VTTVNPRLDAVRRRLAANGITVTVVERDGVVYANVHGDGRDDPRVYAVVLTAFLAVGCCVQVR
jgi:hypothetical protein